MSLKGACLRHQGRDLPVWELSGPRVPLQSWPTEPSRDQRCLHTEPCNAVCSPPKIKECQPKAITSVTCARTALAPKRPTPPCFQIITAPSGAGLQQRGSWHVAGVCTPCRQRPYRHPPTKYLQAGDWAQDSGRYSSAPGTWVNLRPHSQREVPGAAARPETPGQWVWQEQCWAV